MSYYRDRKPVWLRVNDQIRSSEIHLIDEEGNSLGTVNKLEALKKAHEVGLDLVEIGPNSNPPICKIVDYGKYKYELQKKQKNKPSHAGEVKEIRFSVTTDEHDFTTKTEKARKFLDKGFKLRVTVKMKGRQNIYYNRAIEQINKVRENLNAEVEQSPVRMGNRFSALLIKGMERKNKDAKDKN